MGQRHQVYVYSVSGKNAQCIGAFHLQWRYGVSAAVDCIRMSKAIMAAKQSSGAFSVHSFYDPREVDTLAKAIYGVSPTGSVSMVHNEADGLIEDGHARPERGDNNDGCTLLVIDNEQQEVRACLFAINGLEGNHSKAVKNYEPMSPQEYTAHYYTAQELKSFDPQSAVELLMTETVKPVSAAEFKRLLPASRRK
jgi:hypothetical protein